MMITRIRKQGGAAVVTLPVEVLRQLEAGIGEELIIVVSQNTVTMRRAHGERRRYSLKELLTNVTAQEMRTIGADTAWAREGEPVGRELI
ncbi:MAG: AbrB/MazE/SpoVT family DNA-binding domain-containing protein [Leptospirales bacterium]|jgi:antitoxin ChpS